MGAVIFRDNEVLLVERGNEPWKGWWSLPGGVVETGETLRDAVKREVREETGLEVEPIDSVEIFESIGPATGGVAAYHYVVIDFVCRVAGGSLRAADDARAAQWRRLDALPPNLTPGARGVIEKAYAFLAGAAQANLKS